MQLLRGVVDDGVFGDNMGSGIGREQVVIGGGVEFSLVADQDVDRALEIGRRAEAVFEPDVKIIGRRRHPLLGHQPHGPFRDSGRVFEIKLVECGDAHSVR